MAELPSRPRSFKLLPLLIKNGGATRNWGPLPGPWRGGMGYSVCLRAHEWACWPRSERPGLAQTLTAPRIFGESLPQSPGA